MVASSSFSRRHGRDKSSSVDSKFSFPSLFRSRTNSSEKSRSTSSSIATNDLGVDIDFAPALADLDVDDGAFTSSTSFGSLLSKRLGKAARSDSSSSSSVFSQLRRRFSESPPWRLAKAPQSALRGTISWPLQLDLSDIESSFRSSRFLVNTGDDCHPSPVGDSPSNVLTRSPFTVWTPTFAADLFALTSISEHSREQPHHTTPSAMDQLRLRPGTLMRPGSLLADQREKARRKKDAQDMYQTIVRNAERVQSTVPPYEFLELIGKGSFGRVYKCRDQRTGDLVAIKIADIDENDFSSSWDQQNDAIRDFQKEVSILQQLKDSKARNVNVIHEAFDLHSQLWIVADYCTGGSIRTLLYPTAPNGLEENFVIPIARELAIALQGVHNIDLIHRDVKSANVYITENGDLQLGDFGIVGLIEDGQSKRKTIIGTPHFMPIEMINGLTKSDSTDQAYGTEVDVWSYGITVYEMAAGQPPNIRVQPHALARVLEESPPRLQGDKYSEGLRDFVAFCLQTDAKARPSMDEILEHPYIANTDKQYPSSGLVKLVERFKIWEHGGGSRNSLWSAGGMAMPVFSEVEEPLPMPDEADEWNFSTSDDFDQDFGQRLSQMFEAQDLIPQVRGTPAELPSKITPAERIRREHAEKAANRGEQYLEKLFSGSEPYGMHVQHVEEPTPPPTDLPLRTYVDQGEEDVSCQVIDLDEANARLSMAAPMLRLSLNAGEDTIRASSSRAYQDDDEDRLSLYDHSKDEKRETMSWTFPTSEPPSEKRDTMAWTFPSSDTTAEKRETMAWTFPKTEESAEKRATMAWKFPNSDPAPEKRDTMAWTFDTAGPAEPSEPEAPLHLPAPGEDGQLPPGYRPTLKHTATEPIGRLENLVYDRGRADADLSRLSTGTIDLDAAIPIDLDAAIVSDPADITRPSTAGSATGSTMTDATSGNPFDLEEDPAQNEIDRNRFSYHKQWQSEGGRMKRSSYKSMQMHARGSSLSSTDSEIDRVGSRVHESFDGGLMTQSDPSLHSSLGLGLGDDFAQTDWPKFGDFERYSAANTLPQLRDMDFSQDSGIRTNGSVTSLSGLRDAFDGGPMSLAIEMPEPEMPMSAALTEDADPQLLAQEFSKQMANLEGSLVGMMHALRSYARLDNDSSQQASPSNGDSGFDSTKDTSEDEGSIYQSDTIRRDRTRGLGSRAKSPRLPLSGPQ